MMNKGLAVVGLSALAWGLFPLPAAAKVIRYEIDGRYYSYDSTKPDEIAVARRLIEAANAADQARAVAEAERASNPLASIFGSEAQQAALAAKAHLERVLAEESQRAATAAAAAAEISPEPERTKVRSAAPTSPVRSERKASAADRRPAGAGPSKVGRDDASPEKTVAEDSSGTRVQSVILDPETGIRTTFMSDGSIREEMVDATAHSEGGGQDDSDRLAGRPDESAPEATGSTTPRKTESGR